MTVEHPIKAFSRFFIAVILLCLGSMRFLVRHFAESALQKQLVILYFRGFSAFKLISKWSPLNADSNRSGCKWDCENKMEINRILCIPQMEAAAGHKGVRYSNCEVE